MQPQHLAHKLFQMIAGFASGSGYKLFKLALLFPAVAFGVTGILFAIFGFIFSADTSNLTWTFLLISAAIFFFRSKHWITVKNLDYGPILAKAKDGLSAAKSSYDEASEKMEETRATRNAGPSERVVSFSDRIAGSVSRLRSDINGFGKDITKNERRFLESLDQSWFSVASICGLTQELEINTYRHWMSTYWNETRFEHRGAFDMSSNQEIQKASAPCTVVGISRLPFGIRLELRLVPGLHYEEGATNRSHGLDPRKLSVMIGQFAASKNIPFFSADLSTVPGSVNVYLDLKIENPLAGKIELPLPAPGTITVHDPIYLGLMEDGSSVTHNLAKDFHVISQGTAGSGKSVQIYNELMQISAMTNVRIYIIDPHSVIGSPFKNSTHSQYQVLGMDEDSLREYVVLIEDVVHEMVRRSSTFEDRQITNMSIFTPEQPLIWFVIDEFAGIRAMLFKLDKTLDARFNIAFGRLHAEGRKYGIRMRTATQEANVKNIDGEIRNNIDTRISFKVLNNTSIMMLHSEGVQIEKMKRFEPGMAFYESKSVNPPAMYRSAFYEKTPDARDLEDMEAGEDVDLMFRGYCDIIERNVATVCPLFVDLGEN